MMDRSTYRTVRLITVCGLIGAVRSGALPGAGPSGAAAGREASWVMSLLRLTVVGELDDGHDHAEGEQHHRDRRGVPEVVEIGRASWRGRVGRVVVGGGVVAEEVGNG